MFLARLTAALLPAGILTAAEEPDRLNYQGMAILEYPEGSRSFVNGAVSAFARSADGTLFVGSNRLAVFDGADWRHIKVPDAAQIMALASATDGRRIWVGTDQSAGYLEKNSSGEWSYTSLQPQMDAAGITGLINVRLIHPEPGGAVFVARAKVMRWNGTALSAWDLPTPVRLYGYSEGGECSVYQTGVGLLRLARDGLEPYLPLPSLPVRSALVSYVALAGGGWLAVFYDSIYLHRDGVWRRLADASNLLGDKRAMRAARMANGMIAIATVYGGVILLNQDASVARMLNNLNGLPDDNVTSLLPGRTDELWIGMSTGLVRLTGAELASAFDPRLRLPPQGICRVLLLDGNVTVVSAQRVYTLAGAPPGEPAHFNRPEIFWKHVRTATVVDGRLWLGGHGGVGAVAPGAIEHDEEEGDDVLQLIAPRALPHGLIAFTATGARMIIADSGGWIVKNLGLTFASAPCSVVEDAAGRIWVGTTNGNVHAFLWEAATRELRPLIQLVPGRGLPAGTTRPGLFRHGDTLLTLTDGTPLQWDETPGKFLPVPELSDFSVVAAMDSTDPVSYWVVQRDELGETAPPAIVRMERAPGGQFKVTPLIAPGLDQIGEIYSIDRLTGTGRDELWISGANALFRLETPHLQGTEPVPRALLQRIQVDEHDYAGPVKMANTTLAAGTGRLRFAFSTGAIMGNDDKFFHQTRLQGVENEWSPPRIATHREFTGLAPGAYVFQTRAVDRFGRISPVTDYPFAIAAPWYRRPPALVLWAGLLLLAIRGLVKWRTRRLKSQAVRLEQLVNERTRELSLSNTARTDFLDSFSHEVRRPINGILSLLRQLEDSSLTDRQREHAQLMRQGTESLARVCDEVLNFSSIEYGAMTLEERPLRLEELLGSTVDGLGSGGPRPAVRLPANFSDGFIGDGAKLGTIVGNFLANALKHAVGAPVELVVSCTDTATDQTDVLIEVTDGGPGVPAEEQELIFKRFVRGSHAKQAGVPGTGIGLASCRALARLMGGSVGVESPSESARLHGWPGAGSTFFVRLPLHRTPVAPAQDEGEGPSGMRVKPFSIA